MSVTYDATLSELTQRGTTAAMLLDAQSRMCSICVEQVLCQIDAAVTNGRLTPELAIGYVHEIAAFRRIVARQKGDVARGQRAQSHLEEHA